MWLREIFFHQDTHLLVLDKMLDLDILWRVIAYLLYNVFGDYSNSAHLSE